MKKRELLQDDFIANLMKKASLETPSDGFVSNVMDKVEALPACQPRKKPFSLFIKSILPWILLVGVFVLFYVTSDLPFGKYIPGREYMQDVLLPSFGTFFTSFQNLASNKFYSIALVVVICGGFLFGIERLISHRISTHHHYLI
ncbi:MAG: hypothetical protein ISS19_02715 [Bacteroidales bacterium]|nr:hypothetical protein [Bacteroidales bacterium]